MISRLISVLKKKNRTLLELQTGILFLGLMAQGIGMIFVKDRLWYARSLWFGICMALASAIHLYLGLNRALDFDEETARKRIYKSYVIRYSVVVCIFALICFTGALEPLIVFGAYMSLKFGAYLQPMFHKFYNFLFGETDPVPMTEEEYQASLAEAETDTSETPTAQS